MRSSADPSHETFPEVAAAIGEDPARFLDCSISPPDQGRSSPMLTAKARIRGIESLDVVDGWMEVETSLDRGPRKKVVAMLNQRRAQLRDEGDVDTTAETTEVTA
jgi:hypothetical protein